MKATYSVSQAQAALPRILKEAEDGLIAVSRRDVTVAFVVSRDRMEAILETMEILANPAAMKQIEDFEAGKLSFRDFSALDDLDE